MDRVGSGLAGGRVQLGPSMETRRQMSDSTAISGGDRETGIRLAYTLTNGVGHTENRRKRRSAERMLGGSQRAPTRTAAIPWREPVCHGDRRFLSVDPYTAAAPTLHYAARSRSAPTLRALCWTLNGAYALY